MKKVFLWLLIVSMIAVFSLAGCKTEAVEKVTGSKIASHSDRDGNFEIYIMNADGSGVTRLTDNQAYDWKPCFSPDGQKIAFPSDRDGNWEIYIMNADGSEQRRLTDNPAYDDVPCFSP